MLHLRFNFALYLCVLPQLWLAVTSLAMAQNYVDVESYGGQQVTVNFDALDDGAADPYSTTPFSNPGLVLEEDVPMPTMPRPMPLSGTAPPQRLVLTPPPSVTQAPVARQAVVAPPIQAPVLPPSVQPLGATTPSRPLPVAAAAPVLPPAVIANKPAAPTPPRIVNLPTPKAMPAPVAKAQPLPTPANLSGNLPAALPAPSLADVTASMPVAPITSQAIAPPPLPLPALPTAPTIEKAQALAPAAVSARNNSVAAANALQRIIFTVDSDMLPSQGRQQLADIGQLLAQESTTRVQLRAYAMGTADTASDARRLSLARGLAVRAQLLQLGAKPSQIDVRALGNGGGGLDPATGTAIPADRVDVIVLR